MTRESNPSAFEYEVAVSFASEDKAFADKLISLLAARNIRVFRDEYMGSDAWGKDAVDHFVNLYARKSRYCVLLVSKHYPLKSWTAADRTSARERALRDANEYILPLQLEDVDVPGLSDAAGYMDLRDPVEDALGRVVDLLERKLAEAKEQSGPPAKSHDLRSGNVPKTS